MSSGERSMLSGASFPDDSSSMLSNPGTAVPADAHTLTVGSRSLSPRTISAKSASKSTASASLLSNK